MPTIPDLTGQEMIPPRFNFHIEGMILPVLTLWSPDRFWRHSAFSVNSGGELRVAKIKGIAAYCDCTTSKPLDVHCIVEFSFRSNGFQRRSICVFGAYIDKVFWGVHIVQGRESLRHFVNSY